jgi:DNA repair protein RadD
VLRPADGKPDAIILDHSGAVFAHGLPEDHVEWMLDPERKATSPVHTARLERREARLLECSQCSALRMGGQPCPHCGFLPHRAAHDVFVAEGELGLVDASRRAQPTPNDPETRQRWHCMLAHVARERGYQPGWIAHKYKEKFGFWPENRIIPPPIEPTREVLSWVRSRNIAYAKARSAA